MTRFLVAYDTKCDYLPAGIYKSITEAAEKRRMSKYTIYQGMSRGTVFLDGTVFEWVEVDDE